jgi:fructoselysine-6-P-deglycase FrlB-like protein
MVLKKMVMGNFGSEKMMESVVADSVDFMVERVDKVIVYVGCGTTNFVFFTAGKSIASGVSF